MEHDGNCPICGEPGGSLYRDLADALYGVPGRYHFSRCPRCRLIWLENRPGEGNGLFGYENYYTHTPSPAEPAHAPKRLLGGFRDSLRTSILCGHFGYRNGHRDHGLCRLGPLLAGIPGLRRRAVPESQKECFPPFADRPDRLLVDVGCGSGDFLARMKSLGWNVLGIEPDPVAAGLARAGGLDVFAGMIEEAGLDDGIADQVTLRHVIEHAAAPANLLKECRRILRPGGRLVIYTPNAESLGHRRFGPSWRGLETPRHLFVFSPEAMRIVLHGFPSIRMTTPTALAGGIYDDSARIRRDGKTPPCGGKPERGRTLFRGMERLLCLAGRHCGEEIEVVAVKPAP